MYYSTLELWGEDNVYGVLPMLPIPIVVICSFHFLSSLHNVCVCVGGGGDRRCLPFGLGFFLFFASVINFGETRHVVVGNRNLHTAYKESISSPS